MPLVYKINIIEVLKEKGYTTYTLRQRRLLGESTLTKLRMGQGVSWDNIQTLCELLKCQPGDILEFVPEEKKN